MPEGKKINLLTWQMMRAKNNDERMRVAESMDADDRAAVLQRMVDLSMSILAAGDMDWLVLGEFVLDAALESDDADEFIEQLDEEHKQLVWMAITYRAFEMLGAERHGDRWQTLHWVLLAIAIVIVVITVVVFWL